MAKRRRYVDGRGDRAALRIYASWGAFNADHCANCDEALLPDSSRGKLFCGVACQEIARSIREARQLVASGRVPRNGRFRLLLCFPRLQYAVGGQGYATRKHAIPPSVRKLVIERHGGRCASCRKHGQDIHHEGCNDYVDPLHLVLLCRDCHKQFSSGTRPPMTAEELDRQNGEIDRLWKERVAPVKPRRLCDSDRWRYIEATLRAERRQRGKLLALTDGSS
ncbi:MAG: hypothetical protein M0004_17175 [Actinomycetota bacterium]|nr:hypothetical protein [Actinomycetota bacterium]